MQYLLIRKPLDSDSSTQLFIVENPLELLQNGSFDEEIDRIYMIGSEVKLQVSFEPVSAFRGNLKFPDFNLESNKPKPDLGLPELRYDWRTRSTKTEEGYNG